MTDYSFSGKKSYRKIKTKKINLNKFTFTSYLNYLPLLKHILCNKHSKYSKNGDNWVYFRLKFLQNFGKILKKTQKSRKFAMFEEVLFYNGGTFMYLEYFIFLTSCFLVVVASVFILISMLTKKIFRLTQAEIDKYSPMEIERKKEKRLSKYRTSGSNWFSWN